MSRVKISMPNDFLFSTTMKVRITDLNYGNHLGNDKLVGLIHQARVAFLQSYNYTEMDCCGVGLIMADLAVEYKKEAFFDDDLTIHIIGGDFTRVGFNLFYLVKRDLDIIAKVKTGMVCYDYGKKTVTKTPECLHKQFTLNY
ncbi:acyl-CoA thioesterase [Myroides sp. LJL119]